MPTGRESLGLRVSDVLMGREALTLSTLKSSLPGVFLQPLTKP